VLVILFDWDSDLRTHMRPTKPGEGNTPPPAFAPQIGRLTKMGKLTLDTNLVDSLPCESRVQNTTLIR